VTEEARLLNIECHVTFTALICCGDEMKKNEMGRGL